MAGNGRKKKNSIGEPFVPILKHMINHDSFKQLTNAARVAYMLLQAQRRSVSDREVVFPYTHAEAWMNRQTFSRSIKQLIDLGFIERSSFGGLYRRTNLYRFIEDWRNVKK
jgi:hypothetical protein